MIRTEARDWRETFTRRHAACREHAEADRLAAEKFRAKAATAANPTGRNGELLQNFLREGACTNFKMSRQKCGESAQWHIEEKRRGNF